MVSDGVVAVTLVIVLMSGLALGCYIGFSKQTIIYADAEVHHVYVYGKTTNATFPISYVFAAREDMTAFRANVYVTKDTFGSYDIYDKLDIVKVDGMWYVVQVPWSK